MSKAGVNSSSMKQDVNPFKKDNRGPHNTSSNDKRNSDSFSKSNPNNRDHNRSSRPDRQRDDFDRRNTGTANVDEDKSGDKTGETTNTGEKKFTGRCRLFVGNLTPDITESEFRKMFETFGEISEVYVNTSRGFGFIRLDYRQNAEAAKAALDGTQRKGRILRVRFATHGAALKVKNLHPFVSNELLEQSFSQFGELERCIVIVDDRGKSTGEGIVEFVRKPGANSALRRINEGVFLMGIDPKPVAVEPLEQKDEEDGMPEKFLTKTEQYKKEREKEPRFAPPGTFEYEFGMRWKQLEELEKQRIEQIKKDTEDARLKLEDEMQNALYEYQAEQIRQDLIRQQEELRRLEELRNSDRLRRQQEMEMRRQQDDRDRAQQEERRRADMMMSMRQQEIARGRSGPLDPPGMRSREEMMMAERFGDRMSDRMNDRMPDRMGDRMGQGPGFNMWQEEKQRSEVMRNEAMRNEAMRGDPNMRNEASLRNEGRGREMRGPGASPLQGPHQGPQGGPPSGMNNMERGGPPPATAVSSAGGAQKSSPKPLMQPGGGFGMGSQNSNPGPNNMGNAGGDNGNMGYSNQTEEFSQENNLQPASCQQRSTEDLSTSEQVLLAPSNCSENQENHNVAALSARIAQDSVTCESAQWKETSTYWSSRDECTRDILNCNVSEEESGNSKDIDHVEIVNKEETSDILLPIRKFPDKLSEAGKGEDSCHDVEMMDQKHAKEAACTNDIDRGTTDHKGTSEIPQYHCSSSEIHIKSKEGECFERSESNWESNSETCSVLEDADSRTDKDIPTTPVSESCLSSVNPVPIPSYASSDSSYSSRPTQAQPHTHCNDITTSNINALPSCSSSGSHDTILSSLDHQCQNYESTESQDNPLQNISRQVGSSSNDILTSYHTTSPGKSTEIHKGRQDYNQCEPEISSEFESTSNYEQRSSSSLSCYKQHLNEDSESLEEMDDDEESGSRKTIPNDYQSYDAIVPVSQYLHPSENNDNSHLQEVCFEDLSLENELGGDHENLSYISSDGASLNTKENVNSCSSIVGDSVNDVAEILFQQTDEEVSAAESTSPALGNGGSVDNNEGALRTGDQDFKVPNQVTSPEQTAQSSTQVSGVNTSAYAGTTLIQGVKQPPMMSSSTVHVAQHQGGTIMQHRSMTTGFPGGMAQSTIVQKQALPNGLQTALLQQRTITNGGQTMLVQHRTMTNVLGGGVAQQTVVQQRVVPSPAAQTAALHVQALRQRAIATQQASLMQQQQALRMAHAQARVIGSPILQAQALGKTAVIQPAASSTFIGPRLIQTPMGRGSVMQRLVRQRYMGSPVIPARGVQMVSGRPVRVKLAYTRDQLGFGSNT